MIDAHGRAQPEERAIVIEFKSEILGRDATLGA